MISNRITEDWQATRDPDSLQFLKGVTRRRWQKTRQKPFRGIPEVI